MNAAVSVRTIIIVATLIITGHHYLVTEGVVPHWLVGHLHKWVGYGAPSLSHWLYLHPEWVRNAGWAAASILAFGVFPAAIFRIAFRIPLRDLGVRMPTDVPWRGLFACFICLGAAVGAVYDTEAFRGVYPFFKTPHLGTEWLLFEGFYVLQFIALEFFFRGALLHSLERRFGTTAVWVTVIPYVMVHFQKPWLEALGALLAGAALVHLSIRCRSIWPGVLLHVGVALCMDLLAIYA